MMVSDEVVSSQEERHHTLLALAYVAQILQQGSGEAVESAGESVRRKLQQLLWQSTQCDAGALHGQWIS